MNATKPPAPAPADQDSTAQIAAGIADAEAGRTMPYANIRRWLLSWARPDEEASPACKSSL